MIHLFDTKTGGQAYIFGWIMYHHPNERILYEKYCYELCFIFSIERKYENTKEAEFAYICAFGLPETALISCLEYNYSRLVNNGNPIDHLILKNVNG